MKNKTSNRKLGKIIFIFIVVLVIAVILEMQITWIMIKGNARRTTTLLLDQIENVIDDNNEEVVDQTSELKEEYISYAKAVAYIVSADPELIYDIDELKEIANLQKIDEIHIFDETGTIISGTVPEYYGYSFDSGEQMGYFKPMLGNKTLSMCQDVTPNTAEGKSMMYAIAWNQAGTFMIQVGITPTRLLNALDNSDISNLIDNIPITEGYNIYVVEKESNVIEASTDGGYIGTEVSNDYFGDLGADGTNTASGIIANGTTHYFCNARLIDNYVVAVTYEMEVSMGAMAVPLTIFVIYLSLAGILIVRLFIRRYHSEEEKEKKVLELSEYTRIMSSTGFGLWHIILEDNAKPRMQPNEKMAELLGISGEVLSEEEIYSAWYDNIVPDALPSVQASVQEMIDGNFSENTYQWKHPDKGIIYVRCGGTAEILDNGTVILSGYHAEVTEIVLEALKNRQELENAMNRAESSSRAKTTFLFNMSHDIRTPMNAIIGYTELLKKNLGDPDKCRDYIEKLQTSGEFLLSLINNVLEMARIESGKATLDEKAYRTGMVLNDITSVYTDLMEKKNIKFTHVTDVETEYIYGDVVKLKEIFLNIISNAYKYTPEGGSVSVVTKELPYDRPGYALMQTTFADTGIGMSKEYLPIIFEEFSRERTSTETKIQGTGLGMPIVKRLIDLMDGTITVESEPGKGTTFVITLPHRIAKASDTETEGHKDTDVMAFEGKRILLAEDNDLNAEIATEILSEVGFEIERAQDGAVCVDMLKKAPANYYDVILMDIQMPNMDGYTAARTIRAMDDQERNNIPIFAMTANAFDEDKKAALDAGMNGHLSKPIEIQKVMEALESVFKG